MRFRFTLPVTAVVGLALLLAPAAFGQDPPAEEEEEFLQPRDITAEQVGESVVIRGQVTDTQRNNDGVHIFFLGANLNYPFQVLIPLSHLHNWTGTDPVKRYSKGRILRIAGTIEEQADRPLIFVKERDQIRVIPRRRRRRR